MLNYKFKCWLTLEEHGFQGGFGSKINNWLYKNYHKKIEIINLNSPNQFIHYLGKQDYVRQKIGINSEGIVKIIKKYV